MIEHNGHNGKTSPLATVARDVSQVAHDVVELAELQAAMARIELQGWWKQFVWPIVLSLIAAVLAASCVLILLVSAALQLAESAAISLPLSLFIVACGTAILAGALVAGAYAILKKVRGPLQQSKQEFTRNLRWIKTALRSSTRAAATSQTNEGFGK